MDVISIDQSIHTSNPYLVSGKQKYSIRRYKETKRINIFALTIRQLAAEDAGIYQCVVMQIGIDYRKHPTKNGTVIVQCK